MIPTLALSLLVAIGANLAMPSPGTVAEASLSSSAPHGKMDPSKTRDDNASLAAATRQFSCASLAYGLSAQDCNYMASIGMFSQGRNDVANNGNVWIGSDGPNTFTFTNAAGVPIVLIVWYQPPGDGQASFMNVRQPQVSYSLPASGSAVQISAANGVAGAWAALYNHATRLSPYGQISNTFGEFDTGAWATADVSRLVNMAGNAMRIGVFHSAAASSSDALCVSDLHTCAYTCKSGGASSCGASGTYELINCSGPHTGVGTDGAGNPTGGCQGWSNGGHLNVVMS